MILGNLKVGTKMYHAKFQTIMYSKHTIHTKHAKLMTMQMLDHNNIVTL